jgi:hypothetical protein
LQPLSEASSPGHQQRRNREFGFVIDSGIHFSFCTLER